MKNFLSKPASFQIAGLLVLGLAAAPRAEAQTSIRDGLVAEWNFDETSGLAASDAAGDNDGRLENFADDDSQWVDGQVGGAIAFDGSNYIEVPDAPAIGADVTGGLTVMAWFKSSVPLDASGGGNRMLEKGNNYFFLQGVRPGGMNFLVKHGGANFTAGIGESLEADRWYHIAGVFDGATAKTYIDGQLKGTVEVPGPIDNSGLPLRIGSDDAGSFFNGLMDQVLIWERPLTAAEIRVVMDGSFELLPEAGSPEITLQPEGQTLYEGGTAALSVAADGADLLRYLWFKGGEPLRAETGPTLAIPDVSAADAGEYSVRVQNDLGETISNAAALTVLPVAGLDTGRVAYWAFDETAGDRASDGSDNNLAGELLGFPGDDSQWISGQVRNGLAFDGGSVVSVADNPAWNQIGGEATFSFWIRLNTYGEEESAGNFDRSASYVLRKGNHFGIRVINDPGTVTRTLAVRAGAGEDPGSVARKDWEANLPQGSVELGVWQHFAIVYKGGQVIFHKNGFPIGEPAAGGLGEAGAETLSIGNYDDLESALRYLDGALDELSIWARPLREAEILEAAGKDVSGPPAVEVQPVSQKKLESATAVFQIVATGKRPVSYQWLKDGAPIEGATARRLTLTRLVPRDAGIYSVKVSNDQGETVSEAARLTIEGLDTITSGLALHYPFDALEGHGLNDASDNAIHGVLRNFAGNPIEAGVIGGAIAFDGEDSYIVIPHNDLLTLGPEATVSIWLRPVLFSGGSDFDRVFRKDVNYDFTLLNGGIARVHGVSKTPYASPPDTVVAETWQHFAYVVKNGAIQWYRNGEAVGAALSGKLGEGNTSPLILGNYQAEPAEGNWINRPYQGLMDDLGIWQRALSPNDLFSIYQNGLNGKPLSEGLEPITIRSIAAAAGNLQLIFFTPFANRSHIVRTKTALTETHWSDLADSSPSELGDGLFEVTIPAPAAGIGFYQIVSLPPPPLFFDDFESGAPGWTHGGDSDEWELGAPTTGPGAAFSGANVYGTDLDGNFEPHTSAFLRSPEIDLTNVSVANLSFVEFHNVDIEIDYHSVAVNIIDANSNNILQEVFRAAGSVNNWTQHSIRLAGSAVGAKIKVEFVLETDEFSPLPGFYIDDVSIREN